jgi:hypothetical protein
MVTATLLDAKKNAQRLEIAEIEAKFARFWRPDFDVQILTS